ncbi:hypothetical protein N658DRAFT_438710 [Parathielavia hyrcaniae]|uniref:Calcineurin-like phosphoesterase domain-containing protein n=1 Tax=Parathielavia hyrcaniae TaxID=113614 RepID=A0AAN6Q9Y5_9PEZI|nr:hypothetical protein N658DRAFT_438710 [Parathielavia hyrcaniae]
MQQTPITSIKTPGYRRRKLARAILSWHSIKPLVMSRPDAIRIVCVSDTHNKQPELPPGDVLIHAGDLTENGSFDEVQAGLTWLSSQPHPFKILIAGNHDVLLDEAFLQKYPERRYGSSKTKANLDWGDVIYLEDSSITLDSGYPQSDPNPNPNPNLTTTTTRKITVYGSPWTPRYGISAYQYPPLSTAGEDHWSSSLSYLPNTITPPTTADSDLIIATHGPPKLHLDRRDIHQAGCPYLLSQVFRLRPRLHVFGHIHVAHGRQDVVLDGVRQAHDRVQMGWGGWSTLARMAVLVLWAKLTRGGLVRTRTRTRTTTFVNASAVGGRNNELVHQPIVVEI